MRLSSIVRSRSFLWVLMAVSALIAALVWMTLRPVATAPAEGRDVMRSAHSTEAAAGTPLLSTEAGPPWRYGRPNARYAIIEYADLECPFCRTYFRALKRWIDAHPEVDWQWHHLPLAMHEPAATAGARLVECVGATSGGVAFWQAVEWVYSHTRGNGQGLPEGMGYPGLTSAAKQCLESDRLDALIRAQAEQAARDGVSATPALRLLDRETSKTLLLHGPVEGDALLSALDLLSVGGPTVAEPSPSSENTSR